MEDSPKFERWAELVQEQVAYCDTCQPYDSGECVWIFGIETNWDDIFDDCQVPKAYRERIARQISCPGCGASLDITCSVGVKTEHETAMDALWNKWHQKYWDQFNEFYEFLEKHPYLGLAHGLGVQLRDRIVGLPQCVLEKETWYRACAVRSSKVLSEQDMYPPDPERAAIAEGRYNHFGQRVFYLAETKEGAVREVLTDEGGIAWVQAFELSGVTQVLDLAPHGHLGADPDPDIDPLTFGMLHAHALEREVKRSKGWKPEYFVPRFIADCARATGFAGIRFRSTRHYARNLVLFSWANESIVPIGGPVVFVLPASIARGDPALEIL